jgi:AcrR family transcriptional regulator
MTGDRKPPDPTRRNQRSRQAILAATADLVGEVGYSKLTVEAIAARAGVGKQTIYRWWPDKGAVLLDAYLALVGADQELTFPDSSDLKADLRLVLGSMVDSLADPVFERRYRALLTAIQDDPKLAAALLDRLLRPWLAATRQRLHAAQQAGQLRNGVDLEVAAELLYGPVYYRWLLRTGPLSTRYVDAVVAMTLRALT